MATTAQITAFVETRVAESEVFGWSRISDNTGSRILLSDSGCPIGSFFTSHFLNGYSCGDGTISFETFIETDISCCAP